MVFIRNVYIRSSVKNTVRGEAIIKAIPGDMSLVMKGSHPSWKFFNILPFAYIYMYHRYVHIGRVYTEIGNENHLLSTRIIFKVQRNKNILRRCNFGKVTELIKMRKSRSLMVGFSW